MSALRLPVVALSAEYLVIGHLMRRNILAYKVPPRNEGYDLIRIHPEPRQSTSAICVQVKSRYATDCDRGFPVKARTFEASDFLVIAFLNIGWFYTNKPMLERHREPEFYMLPEPDTYQNERDFAQIAGVLAIPYPSR